MSRNQRIITTCFLIVWVWSAINPVSRVDWLLENIPIFAVLISLLFLRKSFKFSDKSFAFVAVFMALHLMGAHYTYEQVPFGFTLEQWLDSTRNMYDRLVHFSFGFFLVMPLRELYLNFISLPRNWSYYFSVVTVLAVSALYEIFEWVVASVVTPILSITFVGSQGDLWDTQKDMAMSLFGALSIVVITVLWRKWRTK